MATADMERAPAEVRKEPEVNKLFRMVMKHEASDLHLKVGLPPMMRMRGDIRKMEMRPLTQEDMERLLLSTLKESHRKILDEEGGVDFSYVVGQDECRFRVSLFKQRGRLSLVARRVNTVVPSIEKLGLPPSIEKLCNFSEGLVILAGVTGSGKSSRSMSSWVSGRMSARRMSPRRRIMGGWPTLRCRSDACSFMTMRKSLLASGSRSLM